MNIKYSIFNLRLQKWQYCSVMLRQKYKINVSPSATQAKKVSVEKTVKTAKNMLSHGYFWWVGCRGETFSILFFALCILYVKVNILCELFGLKLIFLMGFIKIYIRLYMRVTNLSYFAFKLIFHMLT